MEPVTSARRTGLWIIGARGGVASVVATGLAALQRNLAGNAGLVTTLPAFRDLDLADWSSMVVGGSEIRMTSLLDEVRAFQHASKSFDAALIDSIVTDLEAIDARIRPGILANSGAAIEALAAPELRTANTKKTCRQCVEEVADDLRTFQHDHQLDRVIVFNLASTEPPLREPVPSTWRELSRTLADPRCPLPASTLYAIAAFQSGCGYVNFTPSIGSGLPALEELAREQGVVHAGRDGKTGETLIKSALAPAFAIRNLQVMSWVGHNIFGNRDGVILDDPANKQTKIASKDQLLGQILGYTPQTHISIEYIESLGDWKTAWDHIHFSGFLGTPMTMQFTWQGCDSILAAPLVLDLFRLAERAQRGGETGTLSWLACFFKSPSGCEVNDLSCQYQLLLDWAGRQKVL